MNNKGCNNINASCFIQNPLSKSHYNSVCCRTATPYVTSCTENAHIFPFLAAPFPLLLSLSECHPILCRGTKLQQGTKYTRRTLARTHTHARRHARRASLLNRARGICPRVFNNVQPCINKVIHTRAYGGNDNTPQCIDPDKSSRPTLPWITVCSRGQGEEQTHLAANLAAFGPRSNNKKLLPLACFRSTDDKLAGSSRVDI